MTFRRRTTPLLRRLVVPALALPLLAACSDVPEGCVTPEALQAAPALGDVRLEPGTTMWAEDADLSPDGTRFAVRCDGAVCLWDTATGDLVDDDLPGGGDDLAFAGADGSVLAGTGHDQGRELGELRLTDVVSGETCVLLGHEIEGVEMTDGPGGDVDALAVSPDGELAATAAEDGRVGLWSVGDRERLDWLDVGPDEPAALDFSPDGRLLAVGGTDDGGIELWDVGTRELLVATEGGLVDLAFSPDGRRLAAVTDGSPDLVVLAADDLSQEQRLGVSTDRRTLGVGDVGDVAWSPDGAQVAFVEGADDGSGARVLGWDPARNIARPLVRHDEPPQSVAWSPDGRWLYSVDGVDGVRRTPVRGGRPAGEPEVFETPAEIGT